MSYLDPSGFQYNEYYLYSQKQWEMAPIGVSIFNLASGVVQNAPVVVTASGLETSQPMDPWAQINGLGKYDKVGFNDFTSGVREFALHPDSSGTIIFSSELTENVYIEYEAGPSGYYILDSLDLNPVRNEFNGGFIHFSEATEPKYMSISTSSSIIYADGLHFSRVRAILMDEYYDRLPNKSVVFSIPDDFIGYLTPINGIVTEVGPSGYPISVMSTTSKNGVVRAIYTPLDSQSGMQLVSAYYSSDSTVVDQIYIYQNYIIQSPFILDDDVFGILDTWNYLS